MAAGLPHSCRRSWGAWRWTQGTGSQRVLCSLSPTPSLLAGHAPPGLGPCPDRGDVAAFGPWPAGGHLCLPSVRNSLFSLVLPPGLPGLASVSSELLITFPALKLSSPPPSFQQPLRVSPWPYLGCWSCWGRLGSPCYPASSLPSPGLGTRCGGAGYPSPWRHQAGRASRAATLAAFPKINTICLHLPTFCLLHLKLPGVSVTEDHSGSQTPL